MPTVKTLPATPAQQDAEYTVQQVAARTGLSEHTLRYYERAGLLRSIRRQDSSGHRRYSSEDLARITTLACLRATGLPMEAMRRYVELSGKGRRAAPELKALLERQRGVLEERLSQMRWHLEYVNRKVEYWAAIEAGDEGGAADVVCDLERRVQARQGIRGTPSREKDS